MSAIEDCCRVQNSNAVKFSREKQAQTNSNVTMKL